MEAETGEEYYKPLAIENDLGKKSSTGRGKRKEMSAGPEGNAHSLGPTCPVCIKALGPSTSNQGLNDHIDWCLNKDAITEAGKRTPKKAKGLEGGDKAKRKAVSGIDPARRRSIGSMSGWLKKES